MTSLIRGCLFIFSKFCFLLCVLYGIQAVFTSYASAQSCTPGPDEVAFFEHGSYRGDCSIRGIGDYKSSTALGVTNDTISSIKVGSNVEVILCKDANFRGSCFRGTKDYPAIRVTGLPNDTLTSAYILPRGNDRCEPGPQEVAFYTHSSSTGHCSIRGVGDYPTSTSLGVENDTVSSIIIGADADVVLCRDKDFKGPCYRGTSRDNPLSKLGNDELTSAYIRPIGVDYCSPMDDQVALFERSDRIAPCSILEDGDYSGPDEMGIRSSLSSYVVGKNMVLCICRDYDFGNCDFAGPNFNENTAKSVRIFPLANQRECHRSPPSPTLVKPAVDTTTTPPTLPSEILIQNCYSKRRTLSVYRYVEARGLEKLGNVESQWFESSCPGGGIAPGSFPLLEGPQRIIVADFTKCSQNDPRYINCQVFTVTLNGGQGSLPARVFL